MPMIARNPNPALTSGVRRRYHCAMPPHPSRRPDASPPRRPGASPPRRPGEGRGPFVTLLARSACLLLLATHLGHATTLPLPEHPDDNLVGALRTVTVKGKDTLLDIARRNGLGYTEIVSANPTLDPWVPGVGSHVLLPTRFILPEGERRGIVVNLAQMRLFYFPEPRNGETPVVITHPIGVGVEYGATPLGETRIVRKAADPTWYPPKGVRERRAADGVILPEKVPPGPSNPLGTHALYLGFAEYLIHGTNRPWGIGMRVSSGCIRMYPESIIALFPRVPVGSPVRIVDRPWAVGSERGIPYVQVFSRPRLEAGVDWPDSLLDHTPLVRALSERVARGGVDWDRVMKATEDRLGVPLPVSPKSPSLEMLIERVEPR